MASLQSWMGGRWWSMEKGEPAALVERAKLFRLTGARNRVVDEETGEVFLSAGLNRQRKRRFQVTVGKSTGPNSAFGTHIAQLTVDGAAQVACIADGIPTVMAKLREAWWGERMKWQERRELREKLMAEEGL